jgi:hypothetical protein
MALGVCRMLERNVDGAAIMTSEMDRHLIDQLAHRKVPMVFFEAGLRAKASGMWWWTTPWAGTRRSRTYSRWGTAASDLSQIGPYPALGVPALAHPQGVNPGELLNGRQRSRSRWRFEAVGRTLKSGRKPTAVPASMP